MKILIIDDDHDSIRPLIDYFQKRGFEFKQTDFGLYEKTVGEFRPDIIVLDLMKGSPDPSGEGGKKEFGDIWKFYFCPVVIYSANPDLLGEVDLPIVIKIKKGSQSVSEFDGKIKELELYVHTLTEITTEIDILTHQALRGAFPAISSSGEIHLKLKYLIKRRLAALIDINTDINPMPHPWDKYLYPPIDNNLRLADILYNTAAEKNRPEAYRLILTPSCDIDTTNGRKPKVNRVLCAIFEDYSEFLKKAKIPKAKKDEPDRKLQGIISTGFYGEYIPFPSLLNFIPGMCANLKNLELIEFEKIGNSSESPFMRIASIDSPFRELIAWAFLSTSGRPGVPEREPGSLIEEILAKHINA